MKLIIQYRKDESVAVPKHGVYVATHWGQKKLRKTTVGWYPRVNWGDKLESRIALKYFKESHISDTAEFENPES